MRLSLFCERHQAALGDLALFEVWHRARGTTVRHAYVRARMWLCCCWALHVPTRYLAICMCTGFACATAALLGGGGTGGCWCWCATNLVCWFAASCQAQLPTVWQCLHQMAPRGWAGCTEICGALCTTCNWLLPPPLAQRRAPPLYLHCASSPAHGAPALPPCPAPLPPRQCQ